MEKETLEEMAQEYFENNIFCDGITEFEHSIAIRSYIAGAKLQAERMYSEEELKNAIEVSVAKALGVMSFTINKESFEEFKKKN